MDIPAGLLQGSVLWLSGLLLCTLILAAMVTAPWGKFKHSDNRHVFFGAIVILMVMWSLRAGISPGQNFHLLGVTVLCLMFDWQFALIAVSIIVTGTTLNGAGSWETLGVNILLMGALPILLTRVMLYLAQSYLPHNFYIYVFANAFFTAALASLMTGFTAYLLLSAAGAYSSEVLQQEYLPFLLLMAFPEAFLNGLVMSALVVYRPEWVSTFHDRWYLYNK